MNECERFADLLLKGGLDGLDTDERGFVVDHAARCEKCELALLDSAEISIACEWNLVNGNGDRSVPVPLKPWLKFVFLCLIALSSLVAGAWFIQRSFAWRFSGDEAPFTKASGELVGVPEHDLGFENLAAEPGRIGDWFIGGDEAPGSVGLDHHTSHSGTTSLRLNQRYGSGQAEIDLPLELPAGTGVMFGAWVLSPRGGTTNNKWFRMALRTDAGDLSALNLMDPSPNWRPELLQATLDAPVHKLCFILSTSSGAGAYRGWDWATWVDDVYIGVSVPLWGRLSVRPDSLLVEGRLPKGTTLAELDRSSVELVGYGPHAIAVPVTSVEGVAQRFRLVFAGPAAVDAASTRDPNTFGYVKPTVRGRIRIGRFSVPFRIAWESHP